jgi:hypothetical protein
MLNIHEACWPRGAKPIAFLMSLVLFDLVAFIAIVEPSLITHCKMREIKLKDQRKESSATSSFVSARIT